MADLTIAKKWDKADHLRQAALFILNYIILCGIFVLAIYLNDRAQFSKYFSTNAEYLIYLVAALIFITAALYTYFYFDHGKFIKKPMNIWLLFAIIDLSVLVCFFVGKHMHIYARPTALGALLALLLIGRKHAVFINFIICILLFLIDSSNGIILTESPSLIIGFISGTAAVYAVDKVKSRIKVFFTSIIIAFPVILIAVLFEHGGQGAARQAALYGLNAGVLSVVLFMAILPVFEWAFNIVTDYRLSEITDHDSRLIKRLINEAPGTFNHSIVVSNMAEACAVAIGENSRFARAAAYYHDIGKLENPELFGENYAGGANPHDQLTPELSTDLIRAHARKGYELILKNRLPEELADIATQHHGTMPIKFFYAKARKFTEGQLNIDEFSYPGPKPQTKIAAIIMLADACEAKVRTLGSRTTENVEKSVTEIIDERMEFEQFNENDITMGELEIVRKTIINCLTGIHHDRVKYPRFKLRKGSGKNE